MSVFTKQREKQYDVISIEARFTDRLVGGTPADPAMIEAWLRTKMGLTDEIEIGELTRKAMAEMGLDDPDATTYDDAVNISTEIAALKHTQGFKRTPTGLPYVESRIVKAAIKENVNILFAKEAWGRTKKGPKSYTAERVFVKPDIIVVGEPADVHRDKFVGHITGPKGPQSTLGYYEYVENTWIEFEVWQLRDQHSSANGEPSLKPEQWEKVFTHMELNGLGAIRSQGFGQFEVMRISGGGLEAVDPLHEQLKTEWASREQNPDEVLV